MPEGPFGNFEINGPFTESEDCMIVVKTFSLLSPTIKKEREKREEINTLINEISYVDGVPNATTTIHHTLRDSRALRLFIGLEPGKPHRQKDLNRTMDIIEQKVGEISAGTVDTIIKAGIPRKMAEDSREV